MLQDAYNGSRKNRIRKNCRSHEVKLQRICHNHQRAPASDFPTFEAAQDFIRNAFLSGEAERSIRQFQLNINIARQMRDEVQDVH